MSFFLFVDQSEVHWIVLLNIGKIVVDNAIFRLLIAWSVSEIFMIEVYELSKIC